jgi:UDP-N-acetylmuramoyl-tripeptide--D-alanyl-D-alanine ligase
MKEILLTVLSEGKIVAATPENKNTPVAHAQFATELRGDEDVLIIEYGEGQPGDVERFATTTRPTHAVITGLAPAHLDRYKTLEGAGHDIFAVARYLGGENVYVNAESPVIKPFIRDGYHVYNSAGALGWRATKKAVDITGTSFDLTKGNQTLHLTTHLLGLHQVGPLSLAASLALELGLTREQVIAGIAKTAPFEHRMKPYPLAGGWIIDDTYNGNIEGVRAGTELLATLPAKRKVYVTPGLVDQGKDADAMHRKMGELIATAKPDEVVLMFNSATPSILAGLRDEGYDGEVQVEKDPLLFYTGLDQLIAAGDLILMQNDWTDNYA